MVSCGYVLPLILYSAIYFSVQLKGSEKTLNYCFFKANWDNEIYRIFLGIFYLLVPLIIIAYTIITGWNSTGYLKRYTIVIVFHLDNNRDIHSFQQIYAFNKLFPPFYYF
jgi:hypothetical protein